MTDVRIYLAGERAGPLFRKTSERQAAGVRAAVRLMSLRVADEVTRRGRADIAGAGNFGRRWTEGLNVEVTEGGGHIRIAFTHAVSYFFVFEKGAVIRGKPLLWIPLSFARDAKGIRARDYPGRLFRVDRKSGAAPLLFSIKTREPKYFGKEQVTIPKKFHIQEIAREVARKMSSIYQDALKASKVNS